MIKSIASEVRGGRYLCVVGAGVSVGCEGPLLSKSASVASTTVASRTMSSTEKHTGLQTKCVSMAEIPSLCLLLFFFFICQHFLLFSSKHTTTAHLVM